MSRVVEMSNEKEKEKNVGNWSPVDREQSKSKYSCEIIVENGSYAEVSVKNAPNDAHIIEYILNDKVCYDLTRGLRTKLFDMYYDKFGPDVIQKIDWGFGTISPRVWGYATPEKKKRR